LDTAVGKFMEAVHAFGAEMEREKIRQRTADGLLKRARAGVCTGGAVYGYASFPVFQSGRQDAYGQAIPDYSNRRIVPDEARVVEGIFKMYLAGYGLTAIAKCLNGSPGREAELAESFGGVKPPSPATGRAPGRARPSARSCGARSISAR
jgi:DNA invertase Pin-like site-specific DNA recombinase